MYRRITTYIYSYDNGEKICNCGYCRFDICDNQCKIFINVKVPDRYIMGIAEIYLLTQDESSGKITKEMLGKTGGLNGSICYRQICDRNHMAGSIGMDNIKGVLIYNGESLKKAFYCNLKDEEPNILSLEETDGNTTESIFGDEDNEESDNDNLRDCSVGNDTDYNDDMDKTVDDDMECNENENKDEAAKNPVVGDDKGEKYVEYADIVDWEKNSGKDNIIEDKWQELLFSKFPKVRINFGGEDSEAIKMRPHDLVWFPRKYWRFSNNRCLLNGYYNYRYIMLVKGVGDREGSYYLAVPGKNMVNEAISARKQGFSEFVMSKGDLGFWCCKVGQ